MALPLTYNWRNLLVRKVSTGLTLVVIALVVFVLAVLLSFAAGIRASLKSSGLANNILVLKPGATAESTSFILPDEMNRLVQVPGAAREASGSPLVSRELCVQASIPRRSEGAALANVGVRGVDAEAFLVHQDVKLVAGRLPQPGTMEAIVGVAAQKRFRGLDMGDEIALGRLANRSYAIVGVFESGGGAFESEIWAPRSVVTDSYQRPFLSTGVIRLAEGASAQEAIDYINGPAVGLLGKRETDYYEDLSSRSRDIVLLTTILIGIMAIGAAFAVANTMYAAVDGRRREIAMLKTLGFGRPAIMASFVSESLLISACGCAVGLAASLLIHGASEDFLSDTTWTVLAYELRVTPEILLTGLIVSCGVGLIGSLAPALRASRMPIIDALRKA